MTQTEKNLTKMIQQRSLDGIKSELRVLKNNLITKDYVLSHKDKLPRQEMITSLEEKYKLDFKKFHTTAAIYAVVKHIEDEDLRQRILTLRPPFGIMDSIKEELYGTEEYEEIMETYEEIVNIPEADRYIEYFYN